MDIGNLEMIFQYQLRLLWKKIRVYNGDLGELGKKTLEICRKINEKWYMISLDFAHRWITHHPLTNHLRKALIWKKPKFYHSSLYSFMTIMYDYL